MGLTFAPPGSDALQLHFVRSDRLDELTTTLAGSAAKWLNSSGFSGKAGEVLTLPDGDGNLAAALVGAGDDKAKARSRFILGGARAQLPKGTYRLVTALEGDELNEAALGWLLAGYRFTRYAGDTGAMAELIAPDGVDAERLTRIAEGEALTRDLINTPTNDMGPAALEAAAAQLAESFGATFGAIRGDDLLAADFPLIHTVGRAAAEAPRLMDIRWGERGPALTLVGKGVCFDTGGLNIKPGASMGLMKKDMGGAATVLGLARMIMSTGMPVRLRVLIPAVENAISGNAFRPGDILKSRKGLSVEINNTDAEGRLVLADALALADEEEPDLIISMATLTGAARVAVGPDLAPFYATQDKDAASLEAAARTVRDPVWRLPFWDPYDTLIEPGIADLDNAPKGGFAGSITAALFLRRFVTATPRYMHFDIYGWNPTAAPARPKGGVGQGARALFGALGDLLK